MFFDTAAKSAVISPCGKYRYRLERSWENNPQLLTFVMLNPSTADALLDDPTIRRCMSFAHNLLCGGIVVVNLYAFRATKPKDLWLAADPFGPDNDSYLEGAALSARAAGTPIVCAWGAQGGGSNRGMAILQEFYQGPLHRLGKPTKKGQPRHPLYMTSNVRFEVHRQFNK